MGFYAIYIFISPDIVWHIKSSLDRLYLQLWPCFLFFFFLVSGEETTPGKLKYAIEDNNQDKQQKNIRKSRKKEEKSKERQQPKHKK
jgi:hypothetical protein